MNFSTLRRDLWADGTSRLFLEEQADLELMVLFARLAALSRRLSRHPRVRRVQDQCKSIVLFDSVIRTGSDVIEQGDETAFFSDHSESPYHLWTRPWRPGGLQGGASSASCGYRDHAGSFQSPELIAEPCKR